MGQMFPRRLHKILRPFGMGWRFVRRNSTPQRVVDFQARLSGGWVIVPAFPNKLFKYHGPRAHALRERIGHGTAHFAYGHVPHRAQCMLSRVYGELHLYGC